MSSDNMNTQKALGEFQDQQLTEFLNDSKTWVEFKQKVGIPITRRQYVIRKYLDEHGLNYDHLPKKGDNGMKYKSNIWNLSNVDFADKVQRATNWTELLELCGYQNVGNISTVRRRIREQGLDYKHLDERNKIPKPKTADEAFSHNKVGKGLLRKLLLQERDHKCEKCDRTEWNDHPISLKVVRLNRQSTDNRRENLSLMCANCRYSEKFKEKTIKN